MAGAIIPDDWDGSTFECLRIEWPSSELWRAILLGNVSKASLPEYWDADTGNPDDAARAVADAYNLTIPVIYEEDCDGDKSMIGSMMFWPLQSDPTNWMKCDGSELDTATFPELFAILGYKYGGSGDKFLLPDAAIKAIVHTANIGGIFEVGFTGGEEDVTLVEAELPIHNHGLLLNDSGGIEQSIEIGAVTGSGAHYGANWINPAGSDVAHENMMPYLVLNLIIKVANN